MIKEWISNLFCNEEEFFDAKVNHEAAIQKSGLKSNFKYTEKCKNPEKRI